MLIYPSTVVSCSFRQTPTINETERHEHCRWVVNENSVQERSLRFDDLIDVLRKEHRAVDRLLEDVDEALSKGDKVEAGKIFREINRHLRQHTADETRVLRMIIDTYGSEGSLDDIRTMQQHQEIFSKIHELVGMSGLPLQECISKKTEFDRLLRKHHDAEEKGLYLNALRAYKNNLKQTT